MLRQNNKYHLFNSKIFFVLTLLLCVTISGFSAPPQIEDDSALDSGGIISGDETVCTNELANPIENITSPEGASEVFLEIKWEQKTEDSDWLAIPGELFLEYAPITITETTQYRRCARQNDDMPWTYSNVVTKSFRNGIESVTLEVSHVTCKRGTNGTITAEVTGGTPTYIYNWSNGTEGVTASELEAGDYYVLVEDFYGCTYKTPTINVFEPLLDVKVIESLNFDPACPKGNNGGIIVDAIDGIAPFTFEWSDGSTDAANMDLAEGTYGVIATDANGCESYTEFFTLTAPDTFAIKKTTNVVSCAGLSDGDATLELSGGTPPYNYSWPDGYNAPSREGLATGTYLVGITDVNGCYHPEEVFIFEPDELQVAPFVVNNKICMASVNLAPYGGTAPYSFEWNSGSTDRFNGDLCPGEYNVTVTDIKGCEVSETILINADYTKQEINIEVSINVDYTSGQVQIDLPNDEQANIRIYATNGALIQTFDNMEPTSENHITLTIDLSNLTGGLYLIEVSSGELSSTKKIVIPN